MSKTIANALALFLLIFTISTCNAPRPVSMFKGNPEHTGIFQTEPLTKFNEVRWKVKTGGYVFSSPVIAGDWLYEGSNDSCLYAIDKNTGRLGWKFRTGGAVTSTPAVAGGKVYLVSFDGKMYALDALSGKKIWEFDGGPEKYYTAPGIHGLQPRDSLMEDTWDMYLSSPVVSGGKVYFGSGNGNFYCLDAGKGNMIWKFQTNGVIHDSPAVYDGKVYFGGWDTYLHALDAETGTEIWKFRSGTDTTYHNQTGIQSSPMIYDSMVFFGCRDANLYVLDAATGNLIWKKFNNYSWIINTPVVRDSIVYYGTSDTHMLIGLDAYNGDSVLTFDLNSYIFSSPVIAGDYLYVGDFSGTVFGIDVNAKKIVWKFRTPASVENRDNLLLPTGENNNQGAAVFFESGPNYANNMKFMKALYRLGSVLTTPAVDNGILYFGSSDGYIYALH